MWKGQHYWDQADFPHMGRGCLIENAWGLTPYTTTSYNYIPFYLYFSLFSLVCLRLKYVFLQDLICFWKITEIFNLFVSFFYWCSCFFVLIYCLIIIECYNSTLNGKEKMKPKIYYYFLIVLLSLFLVGCEIGAAWNMGA